MLCRSSCVSPLAKHQEKLEISGMGRMKAVSQLLVNIMGIWSCKRLRGWIVRAYSSCCVASAHGSAVRVCQTPL